MDSLRSYTRRGVVYFAAMGSVQHLVPQRGCAAVLDLVAEDPRMESRGYQRRTVNHILRRVIPSIG